MSEDKPRPVSGEIMTSGRASRLSDGRAGVSDAEYETVRIANDEPQPRFAAMRPAAQGFDTLRFDSASQPVRALSRRGGPLFWSFSLALVAGAFWISGGHAFIRKVAFPEPAAIVGPLRMAGVESRVESQNGRSILFVEGRAENRGSGSIRLPPIEISVTGSDGASLRYFLGTNDTELKPGESYAFSSRLEAPRNGVESVSVSFRESR